MKTTWENEKIETNFRGPAAIFSRATWNSTQTSEYNRAEMFLKINK